MFVFAIIFGFFGFLFAGPIGAISGFIMGMYVGNNRRAKRNHSVKKDRRKAMAASHWEQNYLNPKPKHKELIDLGSH